MAKYINLLDYWSGEKTWPHGNILMAFGGYLDHKVLFKWFKNVKKRGHTDIFLMAI